MPSFNKVILMGNLTRDPDLRSTPSGLHVAKLGLAVSEMRRDPSTGEQKETACFVDVEVWDKLASLCGQYLSKGRPVLVEGRLRMDEWTSKEGEKRSRLVVRADAVKFLGAPPPKAASGDAAPQAPAAPARAAEDAPADLAHDDEQLPF